MTIDMRQIMANSLREQGNALLTLSERVDDSFEQAVQLMLACKGRVIISGMGKSGLIGKKIAATLASTGTMSFFMHPGEAFHGDLGMIRFDERADAIVLISYSGETDEVLKLIPSLKSFDTKIIAITGGKNSTLAKNADVVLDGSVKEEVCPNNLAPTTSTTVAIAIGDALAVALIKARNFQPQDFAKFHPGGSLGRRLLTRVKDVMQKDRLPFVTISTPVNDVILTMTETRSGMAIVMDDTNNLAGVITDGDLRRYMTTHENLLGLKANDLMSQNPVCISENAMLSEAENAMKASHVKCLVATADDNKIVGLIDWAV
ncbi:KpsF/GutQ family sugar-phosphate isomerase [Endozoicomonas sp. 8E]|uniref:KpsF/GutQ family sugar-phosphate isomerase n=1 Tax=Endozoicomonas sp. 8E TaxID=3035692 RepID=UPI0029391570|nr:KpsF/GutQ family sugar-phosphate isomerase [Endozoicomonas sp. 8E]WOG29982.1 KpsF/GutQ family sugar-phosphate isomerase [Endozoicomonas sp. 8E]